MDQIVNHVTTIKRINGMLPTYNIMECCTPKRKKKKHFAWCVNCIRKPKKKKKEKEKQEYTK